jgi:Ca-activated chloride channel family protein
MVMRVAGREIEAEIQTRREAERIYEEAKERGHTAALMTQERPNIFTQKVGNIPPGHAVEVQLTYDEALPYEAGLSSFIFPTVVGPRFIPGGPLDRPDAEPDARMPDTDRVPDASRISPAALLSHEQSAHRIDLQLDVAPGLPIAAIESPSHRLQVEYRSQDRAFVRIDHSDRIPNKDFILRLDLRGERPEATVLAHRTEGESGYLTLAIQPPKAPAPDEVTAKDLFFVVDNSGSMNGRPIAACKELMRHALRNMNPTDRFTIMRFSDSVSELSRAPLDNTPENVEAGLQFVDRMAGSGGTNMLSGVLRALEGGPQPGRLRVVFFLTDGYIGNDAEILAAVRRNNEAEARLFSLGVGSSVNRYLLNGMARLGRGDVQIVRYDADPVPVIEQFYRQVRNPVLTSISVDWGDLAVLEQTPEIIGDLYDGQPLLVHARYRDAGEDRITIHGWVGSQKYEESVAVALPNEAKRPAIASLWARARIREWMDEETVRPGVHEQSITELALQHSLVSKYTAFVAVDHEVVARQPTEALVPVSQRLPLPDGVTELALGWMSRRYIPPGDPIISVNAPSDARRVTAYFPFGLVKQLRYDEARRVWRGRFLVPAGIPDGSYTIIVSIELADGSLLRRREGYELDSSAEEFLAAFAGYGAFAGGQVELTIDSVEPAAEVYVHCPELGWDRLVLEATDSASIDWLATLDIPWRTPPGEYRVLLVVRDRAGNRLEQQTILFVERGAAR